MSRKHKSVSPIVRGQGSIPDRDFWDSANSNEYSALYYLNRLTELAMAMFEWVNLPENIDWRFLEYILYYDGKALFSKDAELDDCINGDCGVGAVNFRCYVF